MKDAFKSVFSNIELLDVFADTVRIIDPIKKSVIDHKDSKSKAKHPHCYDIWNRNKVCDNCIAMSAYNNNAPCFKIDYSTDRIYMITAIPYVLDGRRIVVEIIKDITDGMFPGMPEKDSADSRGIHVLIDNMNKVNFKDSLTGLFNQRYIGERLPADLQSCAFYSKNLSLILVDINNFKAVNDNWGHLAGDFALKRFSEILSHCIRRGSDWVARNGDEFMICMPGADLDIAISTAKHINSSLEHSKIQYLDNEFELTACIGIHCISPGGHENIETLLEHTREKLQAAKTGGRNRIKY